MNECTAADAESSGQVGHLGASVTAARMSLADVAYKSRNLHPFSLTLSPYLPVP